MAGRGTLAAVLSGWSCAPVARSASARSANRSSGWRRCGRRALDATPKRIDTRLLFPAPRGGYIDIEKFRHREWTPALRATGLDTRGPYTMRHTFATWAIESGDVQLSYLATIMGTSVRELEDTYFRWLRRTDEQLLAAFDAYDAAAVTSG